MTVLSYTVLGISAIFVVVTAVYTYKSIHRRDPLNPGSFIGAFFLFFTAIPGMYLLVTNNYFWREFSIILNFWTLGTFALAFVSIVLAERRPRDSRINNALTTRFSQLSRFVLPSFTYWAGIGFAAGFIFFVIFTIQNGGVSSFFAGERISTRLAENTGRYRILSRFGLFSSLLLAAAAVTTTDGQDLFCWVAFGIIATIVTGIQLLFRARLFIMFPMFVAVLLVHYELVKLPSQVVAAGVGAAIVSLPAFDLIESLIISDSVSTIQLIDELSYTQLYEAVGGIIRSAFDSGFIGPQHLPNALFLGNFLPGFEPISDRVEQLVTGVDRPGGSVTPTLIGELYLTGGIVTVGGGMYLYGRLITYWYQTVRTHSAPGTIGIYATLVFPIFSALLNTTTFMTRFIILTLAPVVAVTVIGWLASQYMRGLEATFESSRTRTVRRRLALAAVSSRLHFHLTNTINEYVQTIGKKAHSTVTNSNAVTMMRHIIRRVCTVPSVGALAVLGGVQALLLVTTHSLYIQHVTWFITVFFLLVALIIRTNWQSQKKV